MARKIKLTRQELIDIFTEAEKDRRANPENVECSKAFWETRVVDIHARFQVDAFLRRLKTIREQLPSSARTVDRRNMDDFTKSITTGFPISDGIMRCKHCDDKIIDIVKSVAFAEHPLLVFKGMWTADLWIGDVGKWLNLNNDTQFCNLHCFFAYLADFSIEAKAGMQNE